VTFEIDNDTARFFNHLLTEISSLNRQLSEQITRRVRSNPKTKDDKSLRKQARLAIIYTEYRGLYEQAAEALQRRPEWRITPPDSKVSAIYRNIYKLFTDVSYPGSVESKYEKKW